MGNKSSTPKLKTAIGAPPRRKEIRNKLGGLEHLSKNEKIEFELGMF
jgi:hypothetical protein